MVGEAYMTRGHSFVALNRAATGLIRALPRERAGVGACQGVVSML